MLDPPPHICQLDIADPDRREACGPTAVAMVEDAYGDITAAGALEQALRARYGEAGVRAGTDVDELIWYVQARDLDARIVRVGRDVDAMAAQLAAGNYVIALFHDDDSADPDPAAPGLHFAVVHGVADAVVYLANPWHRTNSDTAPRGRFSSAVVDSFAVTAPPSAGAGAALMSPQLKIALVLLAYAVIRPEGKGVDPASLAVHYQDEVVPKAAQIANDGSNVNGVIASILYSPEGEQLEQLMGRLLKEVS